MLHKIIRVNLETKNRLSGLVQENYSKLKVSIFLLPLFLLTTIIIFLYNHQALSVDGYIQVQKDCFYFLNSKLSQFPILMSNITQLGDALIFLSLLSVFVFYSPKMWESLFTASLLSLLFSSTLKNLFAVPRPAAVFDNHTFVIIGKTLTGHSSLPSGHSITIFTVLTIILFSFMPQKKMNQILWSFIITILGLFFVSTRVGVGAHYPLDVIIGGIVGFVTGVTGIFISEKYKIWTWINNKKYYPFFILLFFVCCIILTNKILQENLFIYYLAFISLVVSLYTITYVYVKK